MPNRRKFDHIGNAKDDNVEDTGDRGFLMDKDGGLAAREAGSGLPAAAEGLTAGLLQMDGVKTGLRSSLLPDSQTEALGMVEEAGGDEFRHAGPRGMVEEAGGDELMDDGGVLGMVEEAGGDE